MSESDTHIRLHFRKRSRATLRRADIEPRRSHKPTRVLKIRRSSYPRKGKCSVPHEASDDPVEEMAEDLKDESKSHEESTVDSVDDHEDEENKDESQSDRGSEQEHG